MRGVAHIPRRRLALAGVTLLAAIVAVVLVVLVRARRTSSPPPVISVHLTVTGSQRYEGTMSASKQIADSGCSTTRVGNGSTLSVKVRFSNIVPTGSPRKEGFGLIIPGFQPRVATYRNPPYGNTGIEIDGRGYNGYFTTGGTMTVTVRGGGRSGIFHAEHLVDASGTRHVDVRGNWTCTGVPVVSVP